MSALPSASDSIGSSPSHLLPGAIRLFRPFVVASLLLSLAGTSGAATATFTNNTPALGANDITQLANAAFRTNNVGGALDDQGGNFVYLDSGRPAQGQTFTTGGNANGYALTTVTLKQVAYETYGFVPDITYRIRITSPSGSALTVLSEETALVPEDATDCETCNFLNFGCCAFLAGSGRYITFTLATPVVLSPNTTYGFDVGGVSAGHYWETDGTANANAYAGGSAYSTGVAGNGYGNGLGNAVMTQRAGDRVFVVALTAATGPLPPRFHTLPNSAAIYAGRTAQFTAKVTGTPTLVYQWQKNGANVVNGGNVSGATTDSLTITNLATADAGTYTLVVTNSAPSGNSVTSAPAILTVVSVPAPGSYGYSVLTNNPAAYWRLDETADPATNPPAFEYASGLTGTYEVGASNGFNGIVGPRPSGFPGFTSSNNAAHINLQVTSLGNPWVTVPALNLDTNRVTMTGWIYPDGDQAAYCGLYVSGSGNAGFAYGGGDNAGQLIYWWAGGGWDYVSGLVIPPNQWSFVAVVIEPTKASLYLGSGGNLNTAVNFTAHQNEAFGAKGEIGHQPGNSGRVFNGSIDDVAVFKRSLSFDEINALYGSGLGTIQARSPIILKQPLPVTVYAGRNARFDAIVIGSSPLNYQWRKNGINLTNGGNISGALTNALTVSSVSAGDAGNYTLVVSNTAAAGVVTSAPPATLAVVPPSGEAYEAAVRSANPVAYWRLGETGDPSTGTLRAFDFWGGLTGTYQPAAQPGVVGPRPMDFPEFESANAAVQTTASGTVNSWITLPALNLNTDTVTFTAWINPNAAHGSYNGLLMTRHGSTVAAGLHFTSDNQLGYTWNGGSPQTYEFQSELRPPLNQWSFVVLVIQPTNAALYLYNTNGLFSTNNAIPHTSEAWDGNAQLGGDQEAAAWRIFDGSIDEVAVFNYAFTPAQILNLYNSAFQSPVTLSIQKSGANVQLTWPQGTLLEANEITGPWTTNSAASPYTVGPTGAKKFFRVQVQ